MKNYKDYKYAMIVTSEDGRYGKEVGLDFYADRPWEGALVDIVFGNSFDDLMGDGYYEGLFQQTYDIKTGKRISYGFLDPNTPREEIEELEKNNKEDESNIKKSWEDIVIDVAEKLDWNIMFDENNHVAFSMFSSAGQDFNVEIEAEDFKTLCKNLEEYYDNFDVSEETYLWLDSSGHGKNGAPYDMIDVYKDMEECKEDLNCLKYHLNEALKEYTEEN